jgi:RNA polymerase-binding protein DksA
MAEYLTTADKQVLQGLLQERYRQLQDEVRQSLNESDDLDLQELAGRIYDPGEESVATLIMDLNLHQLDQQSQEMKAIEAALGRLESGSYGICSECGGEIGLERLHAVPTATRCIDCQARLEQQTAHGATPSL